MKNNANRVIKFILILPSTRLQLWIHNRDVKYQQQQAQALMVRAGQKQGYDDDKIYQRPEAKKVNKETGDLRQLVAGNVETMTGK